MTCIKKDFKLMLFIQTKLSLPQGNTYLHANLQSLEGGWRSGYEGVEIFFPPI